MDQFLLVFGRPFHLMTVLQFKPCVLRTGLCSQHCRGKAQCAGLRTHRRAHIGEFQDCWKFKKKVEGWNWNTDMCWQRSWNKTESCSVIFIYLDHELAVCLHALGTFVVTVWSCWNHGILSMEAVLSETWLFSGDFWFYLGNDASAFYYSATNTTRKQFSPAWANFGSQQKIHQSISWRK